MKKFLSLFLCFMIINSAFSDEKVELPIENIAGQLEDILPDALFEADGLPIGSITDFIISGSMNAADFRYLQNAKNKFTALNTLDMTQVSFEDVTIDGINYPSNEIPPNAFDGYRTLDNILLPDNITTIREKAFAGCSGLKQMPSSITYIGKQAFAWARELGDIVVSTNLQTLDDEAFAYCDDDNRDMPGLTSIILPATLTKIGNSVFQNCNKLKYVIINAVTPPNAGSFGSGLGSTYGSDFRPILYVPDDSFDKYQAINIYKNSFNIKPISTNDLSLISDNNNPTIHITKENKILISGLSSESDIRIISLTGELIFQNKTSEPSFLVPINNAKGTFVINIMDKSGKNKNYKVIL